jgi:hypothetical protein
MIVEPSNGKRFTNFFKLEKNLKPKWFKRKSIIIRAEDKINY